MLWTNHCQQEKEERKREGNAKGKEEASEPGEGKKWRDRVEKECSAATMRVFQFIQSCLIMQGLPNILFLSGLSHFEQGVSTDLGTLRSVRGAFRSKGRLVEKARIKPSYRVLVSQFSFNPKTEFSRFQVITAKKLYEWFNTQPSKVNLL